MFQCEHPPLGSLLLADKQREGNVFDCAVDLGLELASSCLSKNKSGSTLNDVQGGDAMKSHGFSCSHFLRAFLWPWSSDRSRGSQSSLLTVRSREKSALNRSFFTAVHMRGGEYISATSVWGLPKLRRSVRYKSL